MRHKEYSVKISEPYMPYEPRYRRHIFSGDERNWYFEIVEMNVTVANDERNWDYDERNCNGWT